VKPSTPQRKLRWTCFRWCIRLPILLLGLLGLLVFLGVPGNWVSWVLGPLNYEGFQVEVERFRYTPGAGVQVSGLAIYSPQDRVTPLFEAEEVFLKPAWLNWMRQHRLEGDLSLSGGRLQTNLGVWTGDLRTDQMLQISRIEGDVVLDAAGLTFHDFHGSLPNFDLSLSGPLKTSKAPDSESKALSKSIVNAARQVAKVLKFLENFQFERSPLMSFELKADVPFDLKMDLVHRGPGTHRGFAFDELLLDARYHEGHLDLSAFRIREYAGRILTGAGEINFRDETYTLILENTLRRFGLEALSPFALGQLLDRLQLRIEDRCDFQMVLGPNTFQEPGKTIVGSFYVENGFYRDAFFPEISLDLDLDMPVFKLNHLEGIVGQGKGQGSFAGDILYDFASGQVAVDVSGTFYPDKAISLVGAVAERQLREWEFRGGPPTFEARFLMAKKGAPLSLGVEAEGRDLLWRGTAFDKVSCLVAYEDNILNIQKAEALRGKEYFEGRFSFSPGLKGCDFELSSHFYLPDLLQLIGQSVSKYSQPFRFRGDCVVEAAGFMDLSGKNAHDFKGNFAFHDLVYQWLSLNKLTGTINVDDQTLEVPDLQAEVEGGELSADFRSVQPFTEDGTFNLTLTLDNMDLYKVITKATDLEDTPYKGLLSLDLVLAGKIKNTESAPRSDSYTGKGRLEINEGALFRVPLLLGLSELLSKIVKGFGYASQSDFSADFVIGDGKISSEELFLQGNILSIAGPGSYRFSGHKISANLKIHLLKEGILSDALKVILWPIRKLIEVQLTGTLENPDWQPRNLPKEIFGK
jgi:hypothetical protein